MQSPVRSGVTVTRRGAALLHDGLLVEEVGCLSFLMTWLACTPTAAATPAPPRAPPRALERCGEHRSAPWLVALTRPLHPSGARRERRKGR